MTKKFLLHTDGAAKGNPGPAGIGIVLYQEGSPEPVAAFGEYIGETTNNVAEYRALIRGLNEALLRGADQIEARTDSELMARQISGQYKVSAPQILPLYQEARRLLSRFEKASVVHVLRGKNATADLLANQGVAAGRKGAAGGAAKPTPPKPTPPAAPTTPKTQHPTPAAPVAPKYPFHHTCTQTVGDEVWVWNVERLWDLAKGLPITKLPVSQFDSLMDQDCWFSGSPATVRRVADHAKRIYEADLSHPILVGADGELMDGSHRIARAYLLGLPEIDAIQFSPTPEPDLRLPTKP